jgi:PIN domain nuclease of toxin-antitoxin system
VIVLDASAALAFLQGEAGADDVASRLAGSRMGAANLSEVLARMGGGIEASVAEALLVARGVTIEPVSAQDARRAATLHATRPDLSLGDRLCLALADRLDADALTADRAWGSNPGVIQIRR